MLKLNLRAFLTFSNLAIIINYWQVTNKQDSMLNMLIFRTFVIKMKYSIPTKSFFSFQTSLYVGIPINLVPLLISSTSM